MSGSVMQWASVWSSDNLIRLFVGDLARGSPGGLLVTLALSLLSIVASTVIGAAVGVLRASASPWLAAPAFVYIQALRNVPLVILVFWAYFVPPYLGIETSKFFSVTIALTFFTSAYIAEIVRGGILSVAPGNIDAARALSMSPLQIQLWVVLPQAFFNMIPALTGRYITAVKNTSLAFLIGLSELTEIGKEINARMMTAPVEVYATLLMIYFVVNRALSSATRRFEDLRRFNRYFVRI
jgi:polar amino acid transport system permease protein